MTSKQRAKLRGMANSLETIMQIGKGGITENLLNTLSESLEARELIKVNILQNAEVDADTIAQNVAELLGAEVVIVIGRKAVFYRRSSRKDIEHIEL